ncbi:cobalamin 5'-phosphate synthase [Halorhabdus utahensis DSM 12940]|uniref:Adenosylcobinamide-GDP ribazoletransferase n=1 Tax=Halorhabdus utahensis (strain DSM 12940 / JCM 11049 / AX-2) TaxID=519442 RepID=C7NMW2_HALUD|nr:adenosylcobinamide-GDP ribazoletransferase [Halorhabdus utahensis]ACV12660.1 cobalamin 5'-phosphate synthase [Halorhabdus utahensis DSM 12940]
MLSALRGAVGFLTRLPVGHDEAAWEAFRSQPAAFPLVGYAIGALAALPLLAPVPSATAAVGFLAWLYVLTGINHLDGVADLGDAAVVHGDSERRQEVLADTTVGVGAVAAVGIVFAGLATAGYTLAQLPARAALLVVAGEVGAKTAVALAACLGTATHDGLGAQFTDRLHYRHALAPLVVAFPAVALTWPDPSALVAVAAAVTCGVGMVVWARRTLGGVDGDVLGATAELARVVGLHAGVIAWTLF